MHFGRTNMYGASARSMAAVIVAGFALLLIVSILGTVPSLHHALGIGSTDALDEGVLIPKLSVRTTSIAPVLGLLALACLVATATSRAPLAARLTPSGARATVRSRATALAHRRVHAARSADDDTDLYHTFTITIPALRSVPIAAHPKGFRMSRFCSASYREEGFLTR